jgi:hypothetical protein
MIKKEIDNTMVKEKSRMTANHTYNSKTQRGRLTQISKSYLVKDKNNLFKNLCLKINKKGSVFNAKKDKDEGNSKLDFSDLKRISSFKAGVIGTETSTEGLGKSNCLNIFAKKKNNNNQKDKSKSKIEEDKIIKLKSKGVKNSEIEETPLIYTEESEYEDNYEMGSKVQLVDPDKTDDAIGINLTTIENKNENRRRVQTEYTKLESEKLFEFRKNFIQIEKGGKLKRQTNDNSPKESNNNDDDDTYLRVLSNVKRASRKQKSQSSFNRSNTMANERPRSINKSFFPKEKNKLFTFNQNKKKQSKIESNPKPKSIKNSMKSEKRTSIEKRNSNLSIMKELSREPSNKNESIFRGKSISDPIQEYKAKYKSDNVLHQLGRRDDEGEALKQTISISDFEVVKELGKGKFGKVLKVQRKINGDEFAVKLIPIKNSLDKYNEANLNSESEIFKTISHRYVVKAYYW